MTLTLRIGLVWSIRAVIHEAVWSIFPDILNVPTRGHYGSDDETPAHSTENERWFSGENFRGATPPRVSIHVLSVVGGRAHPSPQQERPRLSIDDENSNALYPARTFFRTWSDRRIADNARRHFIPAVKVGNAWMMSRAAFEAWIAGQAPRSPSKDEATADLRRRGIIS